jgi:tetratricopeptide (TPR) repeat protein
MTPNTLNILNNPISRTQQIKTLKEIISSYKKDDSSEDMLSCMLKLVELHIDDKNFSDATELLDECREICEKTNNIRRKISVLNKYALINAKKSFLDIAYTYTEEALFLLRDINFTEGYLECQRILAAVAFFKQEYEDSLDICINSINLCAEEHIQLKGHFHNTAGLVLMAISKPDKATEAFHNALKCYEISGYTSGLVGVLINIGAIYADYNEEYNLALEYFTMVRKTCIDNTISDYNEQLIVNIAEMYYRSCDYETALSYYNEGIEKSIETENSRLTFYCNYYLMIVYFKLNQKDKALQYYHNCEAQLSNELLQSQHIGLYYGLAGEMFYLMNDYENAKCCLNTSANILKEDDLKEKRGFSLILKCAEISSIPSNKISYDNFIEITALIDEFKSPIEKANNIIVVLEALWSTGNIDEFNNLQNKYSEILTSELPEYLMQRLEELNNKIK